jgi:rhodanese-related sulfurtransferase
MAGGEGLIGKGLLALALIGISAYLPWLVKRLRGSWGAAAVEQAISSDELRQRLQRKADITVLDVRSAEDYVGELGHIEGSINIPFGELPTRLSELESRRNRSLAVICRTNRVSDKAVQFLRDAGFRQALLVGDGMVGWRRKEAFRCRHTGERSAVP